MELVARPTAGAVFTTEEAKPASQEEEQPPSIFAAAEGSPQTDFDQQPTLIPNLFSTQPRARNLRPVKRVPSFVVGPRATAFRQTHFPEVTDVEWNDWRWQIRHRVNGWAQLTTFISPSPREAAAFSDGGGILPLAITPYYLSLIDSRNADQALRRCMVPTAAERVTGPGEADDPLGEDHHEAAPGLVHRYPDRVLLLVTGFCSAYCRYCTRSRMVAGRRDDCNFDRRRLERALAYIQETPAIRDVLISGGDPLTLADEDLEWILKRLKRIKHLEIIRIGTKAPVVLPQRITPALVQMLKKYHPLFMSIHFTHPDELTPEVAQACQRLADAGIPLGSQTVLLKGINDQVETLKALMHGLLRIRVRPYYLYQCDPISGSAHFRTSVARGLEMIRGLRGHTTGYAVPTYVIDAPGGGGKIALSPEAVVGRQDGDLILTNWAGRQYAYPDPEGEGNQGVPSR